VLDPEPAFRPIRMHGGYPPLADLGLIGDGATAALVGLDGSVRWMCVPSFDSEPLFCALLDHARGGEYSVTPERLVEARQRYEPDTGVLITELRSDTGLVQLTDALALRSGADLTDDAPANRGELVRSAVVLEGSVRLRVDVQPRGVRRSARRSTAWPSSASASRAFGCTCGRTARSPRCRAPTPCSRATG
jgi:alpha,alpha-trehalase